MAQRKEHSGKRFLAAVSIALFFCACGKKAEPPPPPAPEVQVTAAVQRDVPIYVEFVGQTRGAKEVEVRSRVEGYLDTVNFEEGSFVRKGQLLYTIDPRPFQAALAQAKGQLAQAEAQLGKAMQDVNRFKPLVEQNAIPRQDYDTALSRRQAAEASVEAAQATVRQAELELGFTRISAPMNGLIGKTEINPGNLVGRQNTLLTSISDIDPIHVRFSVSEQEYLLYIKAREKVSRGERSEVPLELLLADGSAHPHQGRVAFTERTVDPTTGTLQLEASFPNPDKTLLPGLFARVRAAAEVRKRAVLIPQKAVQELQATFNVAVVGAGDKVEIRPVKPGPRVDSMWIIEEGLNPGERVVVEGLQKVRPGMTVKAVPVTAGGAAVRTDNTAMPGPPEADNAAKQPDASPGK
ncbi:MAG: efflux RND transporter periplasmic adaptor subunit [Deltaproteobacteria bacterium]|nr:MAG: efflux RND transporter periplasmic adaptor subunit [Deltaproteobacteria bacterium]